VRNVSAAPIDAPAEHPDAELFRLDQEMEEAFIQMNRQAKVCKKVGRRCEKLYPPRPPQWKEPDMPEEVRAAFQAMTIKDMVHHNNKPAIYAAWSREVEEQRAANKALQDAHHAKWEEINCEFGVDAAEDAFGERNNELWDIGRRIFATPATTLEGMAIKIRASDRMDLESFADENEGFASIAADIRRLAGAVS
jgi:hypothetical protein